VQGAWHGGQIRLCQFLGGNYCLPRTGRSQRLALGFRRLCGRIVPSRWRLRPFLQRCLCAVVCFFQGLSKYFSKLRAPTPVYSSTCVYSDACRAVQESFLPTTYGLLVCPPFFSQSIQLPLYSAIFSYPYCFASDAAAELLTPALQ
jgi:hypothetical protein